jgi:predicted phosphodiesterase
MIKLYGKFGTFDKCAVQVGCNRKTFAKYWYENELPNPMFIPKKEEVKLETYKIGVCSDMHWGSKEQQKSAFLDYINVLKNNNVKTLLICGDVIEGLMPREGAALGRFLHGIDEIFDYTCGIFNEFADDFDKIVLIGGNHDNSLNGRSYGFDIIGNLSDTYGSIEYNREPEDGMKPVEIDGGLKVVMHHGVGGCAQNLTTRTRNLTAKYMNYSDDWSFLFAGHCHGVSEDYWLGKYAYSVGCFQAITSYLASKLLTPSVEGMILSYQVNDNGKPCNILKNPYKYNDRLKIKDW